MNTFESTVEVPQWKYLVIEEKEMRIPLSLVEEKLQFI